MSRFTTDLINGIQPYTPGEQPGDKRYIKLNTNENPFYTSQSAVARISESVLRNLNRYSDPECNELTKAIAAYYGVEPANVLVTNGSDEALAFAFYSYCKSGVCYPDVTYGFYDVIANLFGCPIEHIALEKDFTVNFENYFNKGKTVVLANPNAQTGIELSLSNIEQIIKNNRDNIVIIDQAYADFGNCNAIGLTKQYDNLVVVNTFSKSRSLAGARVGYVIASEN
ncbi:MAG: aminotransferase class I/II-fold pyridoxal phosphate-dependent enzyme [Clostridia bacterium]|nr:aminotransferase class I/II-fold pyridoxal phosphate-dependent enzyme [Clostridia bacterium]